MTKQEFIAKVQEGLEIEVPKKDIATILDAVTTTIVNVLKEDHSEKITLGGLGTFTVKEVEEKSGVSAINGKAWTKPAHAEIKCKIAKSAKEI